MKWHLSDLIFYVHTSFQSAYKLMNQNQFKDREKKMKRARNRMFHFRVIKLSTLFFVKCHIFITVIIRCCCHPRLLSFQQNRWFHVNFSPFNCYTVCLLATWKLFSIFPLSFAFSSIYCSHFSPFQPNLI